MSCKGTLLRAWDQPHKATGRTEHLTRSPLPYGEHRVRAPQPPATPQALVLPYLVLSYLVLSYLILLLLRRPCSSIASSTTSLQSVSCVSHR